MATPAAAARRGQLVMLGVFGGIATVILAVMGLLSYVDSEQTNGFNWIWLGGFLTVALILAIIFFSLVASWGWIVSVVLTVLLIALLVLDGTGLAWDNWWFWKEHQNQPFSCMNQLDDELNEAATKLGVIRDKVMEDPRVKNTAAAIGVDLNTVVNLNKDSCKKLESGIKVLLANLPASPVGEPTVAAQQPTSAAIVPTVQAPVEPTPTQESALAQEPTTATPVSEATKAPAAAAATKAPAVERKTCEAESADGEFLDGLTSLDSAGFWVHASYWLPDGSDKEHETILEPDAQWSIDLSGGTDGMGGGKFWKYPKDTCSFDQVRQQVTLHTNRRPDKSLGYVAWDQTGVFTKN